MFVSRIGCNYVGDIEWPILCIMLFSGFILHTKGTVKFIPQLLEQRNAASYEFFVPLKLKLDFLLRAHATYVTRTVAAA